MTKYFKDKKFWLAFLDHPEGLRPSVIPRFIFDEATGKSLVVAARGGPMEGQSIPDFNLSIRISENAPIKEQTFRDIYDYICNARQTSDFENLLKLNPESAETIMETVSELERSRVPRLLVLAESDGSSTDGLFGNPKDWACCIVKEGGPELVIDFLLSRFCRRTLTGWFHQDDPSVKVYSEPPWDESGYVSFTDYHFSNSSTFEDLVKHEEDFDDEACKTYRTSADFYYYSVNLEALPKLDQMIRIPYRVRRVLTAEQSGLLDAQVPEILLHELDYIAKSVLRQRVRSYRDDQRNEYRRRSAQAWGSAMYDALGGDGEDDVYLGEGLCLSRSGRVVDE
jgi:hypothetical protein